MSAKDGSSDGAGADAPAARRLPLGLGLRRDVDGARPRPSRRRRRPRSARRRKGRAWWTSPYESSSPQSPGSRLGTIGETPAASDCEFLDFGAIPQPARARPGCSGPWRPGCPPPPGGGADAASTTPCCMKKKPTPRGDRLRRRPAGHAPSGGRRPRCRSGPPPGSPRATGSSARPRISAVAGIDRHDPVALLAAGTARSRARAGRGRASSRRPRRSRAVSSASRISRRVVHWSPPAAPPSLQDACCRKRLRSRLRAPTREVRRQRPERRRLHDRLEAPRSRRAGCPSRG